MILFLLAQAAAAAGAPPAVPVAQPSGATAAPAVSQAAAREGVTTYGPDFFAAYRPNNALEMVQRLPGFTLDTGDTVRGYEGAAGNVLIDGQRPATKADTLDQSLYRIPASAVDHIDVIRGSAPGIDMQGKTVIANVVRKGGGQFHGLLAAQDTYLKDGRNYWAARAEGSGKVGPVNWEGGLLVGEGEDGGLGDGPLSQVSPKGQRLQEGTIHAQGEAYNFVLNGAAEAPLWGGRLRLNTRINSNPYDANETDFITLPGLQQQTEHQDDDVFSTEYGARYTHPLGGRASLETVLLRQDKHERFVDDFRQVGDRQLFHLDDRTAETIGRAVLTFPQNARLSWEGGAEFAYNTLESATTFSDNGAAVALPAARVVVQEKRGEAFLKAIWRATQTLTLEGGLREEGSEISASRDVALNKTLYYTKPRVVLTWQALSDTQVRVRIERFVGQLDFNSFVAQTALSSGVVTAGNPNLVPEQDWISEAAVEQRFFGQGSLVLTLRHTDITGAVDRAPFGDFDAPANIGGGTKDEEIAILTLPFDHLGWKGARITANSTWRQSQVTDPTTHAPREISGLHPNDWEVDFTQDLPARKLTFGMNLYGQTRERYYRFNAIETRKYGDNLSTYLDWKPRPDIAWRLEMDNSIHRSFKRDLQQFGGARDVTGLDFIQDRAERPARVFSLRLRKLFGV